jgi:hypothetical protein
VHVRVVRSLFSEETEEMDALPGGGGKDIKGIMARLRQVCLCITARCPVFTGYLRTRSFPRYDGRRT